MVTQPGGGEAPASLAPPGIARPGVASSTGSPHGGPLPALGTFVLILIAALALREVASLILPPILGFLIALVAWPMVGAPERRGVRRGIALASTIAVVLAVVLLAAGIVALSVGELVVQIPVYETRLSAALAGLRDQVARLGIAVDPAAISTVVSPERIFAFVSRSRRRSPRQAARC